MSKMEGKRTWKKNEKKIFFFLFILYIFLLWTILCEIWKSHGNSKTELRQTVARQGLHWQ